MINYLYKTFRPAIFVFDPEKVHHFASLWIQFIGKLRKTSYASKNIIETNIFSHTLPGPVVMAAGFDKKGDLVNGLYQLGFALVETGTFTKRFQKGNDKPRIFRIPSKEALFNRMGFNNPGIQKALHSLEKADFPFSISIGKSKETAVEDATADYVEIIQSIESFSNGSLKKKIVYLAINISSPNTPGLRLLQNKKYLEDLIFQCRQITKLPLVVKFSPDFNSLKEYESLLKVVIKSGISGVIVTNTTSDENITNCVPDEIRTTGGGLSGYPLKIKSEQYLKATVQICKGKIPVIASGGIMSPADVWKRIEMGASLVQIYTGFIYNGPDFAWQCRKYVETKVLESGFKSFSEYLKTRGLPQRPRSSKRY